MTRENELNAPWTLHFDGDGTEAVGIICDNTGHDLARSRHFWLQHESHVQSGTRSTPSRILWRVCLSRSTSDIKLRDDFYEQSRIARFDRFGQENLVPLYASGLGLCATLWLLFEGTPGNSAKLWFKSQL